MTDSDPILREVILLKFSYFIFCLNTTRISDIIEKMLRRQIRERREFIYRKSEDARARKIEAEKRKAREDAGLHLDDKLHQTSYEEQEKAKLSMYAKLTLLLTLWHPLLLFLKVLAFPFPPRIWQHVFQLGLNQVLFSHFFDGVVTWTSYWKGILTNKVRWTSDSRHALYNLYPSNYQPIIYYT